LRRYATGRKVTGSSPDQAIDFFFILSNPSSHSIALGLPQPLTEMSTENVSGNRALTARKANNLTAICEQIF
jgi:hypothetical protein